MNSSRSTTWLSALFALLVVCALPATASTQESDTETPASVVLSPHFHVFADQDGAETAVDETVALYEGAREFAASHPRRIDLFDQRALAEKVEDGRGFEDKLKIAELATELGIDSYKRLQPEKARDHLQEALENYEELRYELVNPQRVSEVALYLALSYLEQDRRNLRLFDMFQRMTLLDPSRVIRDGFYADHIVEVYQDTHRSLVRTLSEDGPERAEAHNLAEFAGAEYAVYGYAWPEDDAHRVALFVYSREEEQFLSPETLRVTDLEPETLREAGNRLMSRYAPCFAEPVVEEVDGAVARGGQSPFSLEFGFAYTSFLEFPGLLMDRTEPWGNYGLALDSELRITRDFSVTAGIQILNSLRDYAGLLADDFSTLRGFAGGELGVDIGRLDIGLQFNLEATKLGSFNAYVEPTCAAGRRDCGQITMEDNGPFVGVNAGPRIKWETYDAFSVVARFDASYYFLPLSGGDFNFPITSQIGVSYRF
ncbi:MAG: hypothetical protein ACOCV2_04910 [Persicimonas sp.]